MRHWTHYAMLAMERPLIWLERLGFPRVAYSISERMSPVYDYLAGVQCRYYWGRIDAG